MTLRLNLAVVGHVDHGKSTLTGRLLADTGNLPDGKLDMIRAKCERNAKSLEYAYLLDALKDEQSQGITIDYARCFLKTARRKYLILDTPGHIEFLKNMISGSASADAALLIIDANEGMRENSFRHGYFLSMLGIRQFAVCVNKMDIADYRQATFTRVRQECTAFFDAFGMRPSRFIPVSGRHGDNISKSSPNMPWYNDLSLLEQLEEFHAQPPDNQSPLRLPVQDVYKFTENGDHRRIIAGRIETGILREGDRIIFTPSNKQATARSIERFGQSAATAVEAGCAAGFTCAEELYVARGEIVARADELPPQIGSRLLADVFWMGQQPLITGKSYKIKLATMEMSAQIETIEHIIDGADPARVIRHSEIKRNEVARCIIKTRRPLACDTEETNFRTSRFVLIDGYYISGGGIIRKIFGS